MNLIVEFKNSNKHRRTWRVRPAQGLISFGQSKESTLKTGSMDVAGIQGALEYRDGSWWYINLNITTDVFPQKGASCRVSEPSIIRFGQSELHLTPVAEKLPIFSDDNNSAQEAGELHPYQFYVVKNRSAVVETVVKPHGETYTLIEGETQHIIAPTESKVWKEQNYGAFTVKQKIVYLPKMSNLEKVNPADLFDKDTRKYMASAIGISLLLGLTIALSTNKNNQDANLQSKTVTTVIKQSQSSAVQAALAKSQPPEQPSSSPKTAASVLNKIRSKGVENLISRVSVAGIRSRNIVINKNGKTADTPNVGRAIASISTIGKMATTNAAQGLAGGTSVGTIGSTGSGNVASLGTLSGSGVGQTGLSLIEDESEISGGLDREVIAEYIRSQLGQILYCYERQLSASPNLYGKVAVRFTIAADGGIETQSVGETTLKNKVVESCILQKVARWRFPKPEGGTKVVVTYPFLFKSTN